MTIKERVQASLKELTDKKYLHTKKGVTADELSQQLGIQRNVASQYLNELYKEHSVYKVNTRPVYYLDKAVVDKSPGDFHCEIALSAENCSEAITTTEGVFNQLIGYDGSLKDCVEQCKSAVLYPPSGLPVLLIGPSGVGKSHMARLIYEYAVESQVISKDAPFLILNCAEYANNPELLSAALFGYAKGTFTGADKDKTGLIEEADHGVLFLDEIHRLSPEGQEKLFLYLDKGIYRRLGEAGKWHKAEVRMIFATTENPEENFLQSFLRRIPLTVKIPSFRERPSAEKMNLIHYLYFKESKAMMRDISISAQVLNVLMKSKVGGNIGKLTNAIKLSCASAFKQFIKGEPSAVLKVKISDLPKEYLDKFEGTFFESITMEDLKVSHLYYGLPESSTPRTEKMTALFAILLQHISALGKRQIKHDGFMIQCGTVLNELIDYFIFNATEQYSSPVVFSSIEKIVDHALITIQSQYGIKPYGNSLEVLTHLLVHLKECKDDVKLKDHGQILETIYKSLAKEHKIALRLLSIAESHLDMQFSQWAALLVTLYIRSFHRMVSRDQAHAVIIAHGYATASSIASVANRILGHYVFEAFDMHLEMSSGEIGTYLTAYMQTIDSSKGLIILVDMGSLESIYTGIEGSYYGDLAIINNISTQLALDIGDKILAQKSIEDIVQEAVNRNTYRYRFLPSQCQKPSAVITTCSTGIGTAQKIKDLLDTCFEEDEISVIAYDYDRLVGNGNQESVFKQYDVKLIIGTNDPKVEGIPYVSLESLIMKNDGILNQYLDALISNATLERVNTEFVKLFTLENVVNHLTILNPDKIIDQVSLSLANLEKGMNAQLENVHKISLTIHICCMVERLVIKDPIKIYRPHEDFEQCHGQFIKLARHAFSVIEQYYKVELPVTEIGFIYDNIKNRVGNFAL
jgi:sigma-54 dependent transcriptional regulator of gfr operon